MATIATDAQLSAFFVGDGSSTSFTLPVAADYVQNVIVLAGGTGTVGATSYTASGGSASASNVHFNGAPGTPGSTLTFATAPAAKSLIIAPMVPAGTL